MWLFLTLYWLAHLVVLVGLVAVVIEGIRHPIGNGGDPGSWENH